jgi:surface carbohydrate biosynthesis protein
MKRIYLMYETENRELVSRIHLAHHLMKEHLDVIIFQHSVLWLVALFGKPGFICLKSTSYQFDSLLHLLDRRGFKIISWQEEGLHHFHGQSQSPVFSKNSAHLLSRYFAWHAADAQLAISTGVKPELIDVVGNVRFEVLMHHKPRSYQECALGKRVLILTNFDMRTITYDFSKDTNLDKSGREFSQNAWERERSAAQANKILYQELFAQLGEENSFDTRVRPYFYEENFVHSRYGLRTDSNFSIATSLSDCDVLIHYGSTGGIEATVMGIPNLILASSSSGIDSRILLSGSFFDSADDLLVELHRIAESPGYAQDLARSQHERQVEGYEFNFRDSSHVAGLISFLRMTEIPFVSPKAIATRIRIGLFWTFMLAKYKVRKGLVGAHMVKAARIQVDNLGNEIWDPIRKDLQNAEVLFRGRAIHLKISK